MRIAHDFSSFPLRREPRPKAQDARRRGHDGKGLSPLGMGMLVAALLPSSVAQAATWNTTAAPKYRFVTPTHVSEYFPLAVSSVGHAVVSPNPAEPRSPSTFARGRIIPSETTTLRVGSISGDSKYPNRTRRFSPPYPASSTAMSTGPT